MCTAEALTADYQEIRVCRICQSPQLTEVLSLGEQYLTGVFPAAKDEPVTKGPVDLVFCENCTLLQMKQTYNLSQMYGENYGYRSGLNAGMVRHLQNKIGALERRISLSADDLVIDIGSNDATSLKAYTKACTKVGIDPTGHKFRRFYPPEIHLIPDFFTAENFQRDFNDKKAKLITSIAMFYDLEDPLKFVQDIAFCLDDQGLWHFEQSYMPTMLAANAYDTICHEHLEFYSLRVIVDLLAKAGLQVIEVSLNDINGGSFAVTACKVGANYAVDQTTIDQLLQQEAELGLATVTPYLQFAERVQAHRDELNALIAKLQSEGKKIFGYGASTKGNVLLQFCELTASQLPCIAEVNEDKFGSFTPGTHIPIISETDAKAQSPDYLMVLPWHFKKGILEKEQDYLAQGGRFIFPLPHIEIV